MASELEKFRAVTSKVYADQAKFFLNAFWKEYQGEVENIWKWTNKFIELDTEKKAAGSDIDELKSHVFLETIGETLRVVELRETLKSIDLDTNRRMALIEFLLFKYKQSIKELLSRPQGTNDALEKAQDALAAVQVEIQAIEKKKEALSAIANGPAGVKANAAKNELEQLLLADPIPLNKALFEAEAAIRKAQKNSTDAEGSLWWTTRALEEAKKYKPKGGVKAYNG